MHTIQQRVEQVQQHISQLTTRPITLMVASKYHSITAIQAAYATGLSDFGENTLQTALPKIQTLSHLSITWHFIGRLQSNKIKRIAQHFDWIHSSCSIKKNGHKSTEMQLIKDLKNAIN